MLEIFGKSLYIYGIAHCYADIHFDAQHKCLLHLGKIEGLDRSIDADYGKFDITDALLLKALQILREIVYGSTKQRMAPRRDKS